MDSSDETSSDEGECTQVITEAIIERRTFGGESKQIISVLKEEIPLQKEKTEQTNKSKHEESPSKKDVSFGNSNKLKRRNCDTNTSEDDLPLHENVDTIKRKYARQKQEDLDIIETLSDHDEKETRDTASEPPKSNIKEVLDTEVVSNTEEEL